MTQRRGFLSTHELVLWETTKGLAAIADIETTHQALVSCKGCREVQPLLGSRPGRAQMYAIGAGLHGLGYLAVRWFEKHDMPNWARIFNGEVIAIHSVCAIHNGTVIQ